jgi:tetratricopeptide (TPR) repeat protein
MDLKDTLQQAITHHQAGEQENAEKLYRSILSEAPKHPDANHNLGVLLKQGDKVDIALPFFKTALESNPNQGQYWISYINTLIHHGQLDSARSVLEQGQSKGLKGDGVDQLVARLNSHQKNPSSPPQAQLDSLIALYSQGQIQKAVSASKVLIKEYPNTPFLYNINGACYKALGQLDAAVKCYEQALAIKPDYAEAHSNLGNTLQELGQLDAAVKCYEQALVLKPNYAEAHSNLGLALYDLGQLDAAVKCYEQALAIKPDFAEAHNNLGITLNDLGQLDAAVKSYEQALTIKPEFAEAHSNLGNALQKLGQLETAVKYYEQALTIKPEFAEVHSNLGAIFQELGQLPEAVKRYEKALAINPDYAEAHSNLCELYYKSNMISELRSALIRAQKKLPKNEPSLLFRLAQLANHEKHFEDCRQFLELIYLDELAPKLKIGSSELLAKTYNRLGLYQQAFNQFEITSGIVQQELDSKKVNGERYFLEVSQSLEAWSNITDAPWADSQAINQQHSLVFLVGFPRSGTTLLDSILRSHPEVSVVEEKPMVRKMYNHFKGSVTPVSLATLNNHQINELRDIYFKELATHFSSKMKHTLVIDKFPLNIIHVGLIHRIFPDAKFILALRHPYDCVLSCFMQNFKLNDAMANFLTIEDSARFYDASIRLWNEYNRVLDLNVGQLKYEDLIQDLQASVTPMLNFLDLEWDDNLLNYQQTALSRGQINTPSYNQVTQKLYTQANGRWKNYQEQMSEVSSWLDPWVDYFNYTEIP